MKRLCIAAVAAVCLNAHAEFYNGNDLLSKMQSTETIERGLALGYVMGVFDATRSIAHCPPDGITAGQVRDMVRQYLEANPGSRHIVADVQVVHVLKQAWPCAQRQQRGGQAL